MILQVQPSALSPPPLLALQDWNLLYLKITPYYRIACKLPYAPPMPSRQSPEMWVLRGQPLKLPTMAPLLDLTEHYHPEISESQKALHPEMIDMYLSSLSILQYPNPRHVAFMHGKANWSNFGWWFTHKQLHHCHHCKTSTHPTDVMTSLIQCPSLNDFAGTTICNAYSNLKREILDWFQLASPSDKRNFMGNLVPRSLSNYMHKAGKYKTLKKCHLACNYMNVMSCIQNHAKNMCDIPH